MTSSTDRNSSSRSSKTSNKKQIIVAVKWNFPYNNILVSEDKYFNTAKCGQHCKMWPTLQAYQICSADNWCHNKFHRSREPLLLLSVRILSDQLALMVRISIPSSKQMDITYYSHHNSNWLLVKSNNNEFYYSKKQCTVNFSRHNVMTEECNFSPIPSHVAYSSEASFVIQKLLL